MADLTGLTAAVNSLVEAQSTVVTSLADLASKVAAAEAAGVPQASVDALTAQVNGVVAGLNAAAASNDPPAAPAPLPAA